MTKQNWIKSVMAIAAVAGLVIVAARAGRAAEAAAAAERVFELRTYTAAPGKLDALHARFRDHTTKLFEKHGMTNIGYWTPSEGEGTDNTLIYIVAHESREAAKKSWMAFGTDPAWIAARNESEKDGKLTTKIESRFLKPTDYSTIK